MLSSVRETSGEVAGTEPRHVAHRQGSVRTYHVPGARQSGKCPVLTLLPA